MHDINVIRTTYDPGVSRAALMEIAEQADADAASEFVRAAPASLAQSLGIAQQDRAGATLVMSAKVDVLAFNRVIGLGAHRPAEEGDVDATLATYREAQVPRFFVQVAPGAQPEALADWLTARGFVRYNRWMKLVRDAREESQPAKTSLRVVDVTPSTVDAFSRVVARSYGMPDALRPWLAGMIGRDGWRHYLALLGDMPVGAGSLHIVGDRAWTGFAGTVPDMRGRGAQSALIVRRLEDARRAGCRWLVCETAEDAPDKPAPSLHNQLRFGYRVLYARDNWIWKNETT
jgi:hypothetical protein